MKQLAVVALLGLGLVLLGAATTSRYETIYVQNDPQVLYRTNVLTGEVCVLAWTKAAQTEAARVIFEGVAVGDMEPVRAFVNVGCGT